MSPYGSFSDEEWALVKAAPMMAANLVVVADPSGPVGLTKEIMAAGKVVADKTSPFAQNGIVAAILVEWDEVAKQAKESKTSAQDLARQQMPEMPQFQDAAEMAAWVTENLAKVADLVTEKAPPEAAGFKEWVYEAAVAAANAGREGGFLGIGGEYVSAPEQAALDQIKGLLKL
jgi:hypothetical protein